MRFSSRIQTSASRRSLPPSGKQLATNQKRNADLDEAAKSAMLRVADLLEAKLPRVLRIVP